jgi:hypothetical protein
MSEQEKNFTNTVVISKDDVKHVEDFYNNFQIPIPPYLAQALDRIRNSKEIRIEDQITLREEMAHAMVAIDHPVFKDELFANVIKKSEKIYFEAQFKHDVEEIMGDATPASQE